MARKSEQGASARPGQGARAKAGDAQKPSQARPNAASGYRAVTRDIEVSVEPFYLADRSDPDEGRYFWAYHITIDNHSDEFVKLLSRYWHITDGDGRVEEVRGPGVVGQQPELRPGDSYQYTSGCPLSTPSGIMVGTYTLRNGRGEEFEIGIPAFSLDIPDQTRIVN